MRTPIRLLVASLCVIALSCGGQSSKDTSGQATSNTTLPAQTVNTSDPLAKTKPFTVEEFQQAARKNNTTGISPDAMNTNTVITLASGTKVKLGDYVNQLNQLEAGFNKLGHSLRTDPATNTVIQQTSIQMVQDAAVTTTGGDVSASGDTFTPLEWGKTLGNPSSVALSLGAEILANSGPDGLVNRINTGVAVTIVGQTIPLYATTAEAGLPVPLAALDRRYAVSGGGILGQITTLDGLYAAPQTTASSEHSIDKAITPEPKVTFGTMLGPIPLTVSLGVRGDIGLSEESTASYDTVNTFTGPSIAARLFAEATAGISIVNVTVAGEADLVRFTPSVNSTLKATEHTGLPTDIAWSYGFAANVEALKGQVTITATVDLWVLGKRGYTWTILTWPGVQFKVAPISASNKSIERAPLSPMPTVAAHLDVSPAGGEIGAGNKTFGGACPVNTVRSQCRAYTERDDEGECASAHSVTSDVHDCTCQFFVGTAVGKPVHCGADVWVVPAQ